MAPRKMTESAGENATRPHTAATSKGRAAGGGQARKLNGSQTVTLQGRNVLVDVPHVGSAQ